MQPLSPLPHQLRNRVFTYRHACRLGVSRHRLKAGDITSLHRGREHPDLRLRGTIRHRVAVLPGEVQAVLPPLDGPFEAIALRIATSGPETKLRLALVAAGLPEPQLQVRLDPDDRWSPEADLGYRRLRIALQYEGASHRTPDQLRRDNRRDAQVDKARWRYLKFDSADLFDGFARACREVREALRQAHNGNAT